MTTTQQLTQLEMEDHDIETAERAAKSLGYTQTAYTSTSALIGLYCLPDNQWQKGGCIIKTQEVGFLFVQTLEDLRLREDGRRERRAV